MLNGSMFVHNNCPEMYLGGGVMNLSFLLSAITHVNYYRKNKLSCAFVFTESVTNIFAHVNQR